MNNKLEVLDKTIAMLKEHCPTFKMPTKLILGVGILYYIQTWLIELIFIISWLTGIGVGTRDELLQLLEKI